MCRVYHINRFVCCLWGLHFPILQIAAPTHAEMSTECVRNAPRSGMCRGIMPSKIHAFNRNRASARWRMSPMDKWWRRRLHSISSVPILSVCFHKIIYHTKRIWTRITAGDKTSIRFSTPSISCERRNAVKWKINVVVSCQWSSPSACAYCIQGRRYRIAYPFPNSLAYTAALRSKLNAFYS